MYCYTYHLGLGFISAGSNLLLQGWIVLLTLQCAMSLSLIRVCSRARAERGVTLTQYAAQEHF